MVLKISIALTKSLLHLIRASYDGRCGNKLIEELVAILEGATLHLLKHFFLGKLVSKEKWKAFVYFKLKKIGKKLTLS